MPAKEFLCTNKGGGCPRAFSRERIVVEAGQEVDCPTKTCKEWLKPYGAPPPPSSPPWALIAALGGSLLVVGGGGFYAYQQFLGPQPEKAQSALSEFYPDLPASTEGAK